MTTSENFVRNAILLKKDTSISQNVLELLLNSYTNKIIYKCIVEVQK
ncbi:hypothetical protein EMIT079MI2_40015 [Bacillus sp. IT-79MI2]